MSDMISRDAVAQAVAALSQEFLDGGSPTAVKVLNLAMDRIRAIPAADARAEALKEAVKACKAVADELREDNDAEAVGALECALRLTALIPEAKP